MKATVRLAAYALLAVTTIFAVSCGGNASNKKAADGATETEQVETKAATGKGNDYADAKVFSVKYEKDGDTFIYTSTMDENLKRLDQITTDGTHSIYIVTTDEAGDTSGLRYEDGQWEDVLTAITKVNSFNLWKSLHLYYKDAGFTRSGSVTAVAGANCALWTGTQMERGMRYNDLPAGKPAEIAVWNNKVTMRLKSDGNVILEAKAFTVNVPETAFTQTVETSWIK